MPRYPEYAWNARLARYQNPETGRVVSTAQVRRALERAITAQQNRAQALGQQLRNGTITTRAFDVGMREVVKNTQLFSAAAAKGGWAQMDARAYGQVGQRVREQYAYLGQFRDELRAGLPRDGLAVRRAASYAEAGRRIYHEVDRDVQAAAGRSEERFVRNARESCGECITIEAAGWGPIGAQRPIGERECLNGCQCDVEYR